MDFKDFKELTKRDNQKSFQATWYFASLFSKYVSFVLFKLNFSANAATILFFFIGLLGLPLIICNDPLTISLSYLFFRLHIIVDLSDGDLARLNKSYSFKGKFLDYVNHVIIYPSYIICITIITFWNLNDLSFIYYGIILSFLMSLKLSLKHIYSRAIFESNITIEEFKSEKKVLNSSSYKLFLSNLIVDLVSIEGFFFFYILFYLIGLDSIYYILFPTYIVLFTAFITVKFYLFINKKTFSKN